MTSLRIFVVSIALLGCSDLDYKPDRLTVTNDDGDGFSAEDDCDDTDGDLGALSEDADCDGYVTSDDCNDADHTMPSEDADCDGVLTNDDCNDADGTMHSEDADCDGAPTAVDCNDNDPTRYPGAPEDDVRLLEDFACDGGGGRLVPRRVHTAWRGRLSFRR